MARFFKNIILFILLSMLIGELVARMFVLNSEIPRRMIDPDGIQKYVPDQTGKWHGGTHSWQINKMGWPGPLPKVYDNLVTIIGDSFIENFMNPDNCHQSVYLKEQLPHYNFLEASRSGVSFIETMEISKQLDSLKPLFQLIYLHDSDFTESIVQLGKRSNLTQIDLEEEKIVPGALRAAGLKRILYNWKFMYYLYNRFSFPPNRQRKSLKGKSQANLDKQTTVLDWNEKLLQYISKNYDIGDKIFIMRPDTNSHLPTLMNKHGFTYILLREGDRGWSFSHDSHWTCFGHLEASKQVVQKLNTLLP